jgi:hypothetical protein
MSLFNDLLQGRGCWQWPSDSDPIGVAREKVRMIRISAEALALAHMAEVDELEAENERLVHNHGAMLANLTTTQAQCTELLLENRELKAHLQEARSLLADSIEELREEALAAYSRGYYVGKHRAKQEPKK